MLKNAVEKILRFYLNHIYNNFDTLDPFVDFQFNETFMRRYCFDIQKKINSP